jgi:hypothetical protein
MRTILKTRLEVLKSNLCEVKTVLLLAERRGQHIEDLRNLLLGREGIKVFESRLSKILERAKVDLNDEELQRNEFVKAATDELNAAQATLAQLSANLEKCEENLEALLGSRVELSSREVLQERLTEQADEGIGDLDNLLATIDDGRVPTSTAWAEEERLATSSEPLFAEYVDLLRGLALRESGIESPIWQLADRLLDGCDRVASARWRSLAVPAFRGSSGLTPGNVIRLGFPEWSIWALPLAAYELGRIVVGQDRRLRAKVDEEVTRQPGQRQVIEDCLADAFATYTVGPAYACAAILMRLNPRPKAAGEPAVDAARVEALFDFLDKADEEAGAGVSFADIRARLETAWQEAATEAGAAAASRAGSQSSTPADLSQFFWRWAEQNSVTAKYTPKSWTRAMLWEENLLALLKDEDAIDPAGSDVRDVLNAAWLCRLNHPDQTVRIAKAAQRLWERMRGRHVARASTRVAQSSALPHVQSTGRT